MPSGPLPRNQWHAAQAPNGRILGYDLHQLDEKTLLHAGGEAALYALGTSESDYHFDRDAIVLVHGMQPAPGELEDLARALFIDDRFQIYYLCFDDWHRRATRNGVDFASELRGLAAISEGARRSTTILAHSLGGIITRRAVNVLSQSPPLPFGKLRVIAIDTPWHGYNGPSDAPPDRIFMNLARPFIPDGLEDMRAQSAMFVGDDEADAQFDRIGLLQAPLHDAISLHLVFAEEGEDVFDYTEGPIAPLAAHLEALYRSETPLPVSDNPRLRNFWHAIVSSEQYFAFQDHLRGLADSAKLDANAVDAALRRFYPRFAGSHAGVISMAPGEPRFIDYLKQLLR